MIIAIVVLSIALLGTSIAAIVYGSLYGDLKYICLCKKIEKDFGLIHKPGAEKPEFQVQFWGHWWTVSEAASKLASPENTVYRLPEKPKEEIIDIEHYKAGEWK